MLNELRGMVNEKIWLLLAALLSDRAWEFAVAVVGGYMAIKGTETKSRVESLLLLSCAVIISFASAPVAMAYISGNGMVSPSVIEVAKPLVILILAASSLKLLDVVYALIAKLKEVKFQLGGSK